jgi:hypothetical protein
MSWLIVGLLAWVLLSALVCVPLAMIASQCSRREEAARAQRRPTPPTRWSNSGSTRLSQSPRLHTHSGD